MKEKKHLPYMGVGPIYGFVIILCTVVGVKLSGIEALQSGRMDVLKIPFLVIGIILIAIGIYFYGAALFQSKIDDGIKNNQLVTSGVYGCVRNPIYSAFMMACTGVLFIANNLWLLILPLFYWAFMTILMKNTEEKWLANLYGEEYREYCERVNRCIPWFSKGEETC